MTQLKQRPPHERCHSLSLKRAYQAQLDHLRSHSAGDKGDNAVSNTSLLSIQFDSCSTKFTPMEQPAEFLPSYLDWPTSAAQHRDRFIILTTSKPTSATAVPPGNTIEDQTQANALCAILVNEYLTEHHSGDTEDCKKLFTIKIARLDSTGLIEPRQLQRPLVCLLIQTYLEYTRQLASGMGWDWCVHVLAMSNPEYLFPESYKLASKHIQSGRKLVYWWKSIVLDGVKTAADSMAVPTLCRSWLIPGYEVSQLPVEHRPSAAANDTRKACDWLWGQVPFVSSQTQPAADVWPRFEDDAIAAFIKRSVTDKSITVHQLLLGGLLEQCTDFHDQQAGYFTLYSAATEAKNDKGYRANIVDDVNAAAAAAADDDDDDNCVQDEKFHSILKALNVEGSLSDILLFGTAKQVQQSTGRLLEMIRGDCCGLEKTAKASIDSNYLLRSKNSRTNSITVESTNATVITNLSANLIKRKRKD